LPPLVAFAALIPGLLYQASHSEEAVEERRYRVEASARGSSAVAVIRARRRGRKVAVSIESVEPKRMEPAVRMLAELLSRQRSPWLYRGPRWAGRETRERLQAGPLRAQLAARYGGDGWLREATIEAPGLKARILGEEQGEGRE